MKVEVTDGDRVAGKGASTDIIEACARAQLNAINRHRTAEQAGRRTLPQP